jgi:hypothetical protein
VKKLATMSVVVAVVSYLAVPAGAHSPTEDVFEATAAECSFLEGAVGGLVFVQTGTDGTFSNVNIWLDGPFVDEPDLIGDSESTAAEVTETSLSAWIPLLDATTLEPVGRVLTLSATLTGPVGDPDIFTDRFHDGNRWVEIESSQQALGIESLELRLDGVAMPADCVASSFREVISVTNPDTQRIKLETESFIECLAPGGDGSTLFLIASELNRQGLLNVEIYSPGVVPFEEPPEAIGAADFGALRGRHDLVVALFDPFDPEGDQLGSANLIMTVSEADKISSRVMLQNVSVKEVLTVLETTGTVTTADTTYALQGACSGEHFSASGVNTSPNGPKPTGRPPANDTPLGAQPLPAREITSNRSTALEPEVPWLEEFDGTIFEFPLGKTLWYTMVGTGGHVTIDTAGSDFDTAIAVYSGEAFDQVALEDDGSANGFSFQAELSFVAVEGVTYFIQIGGFAGEFGHLIIHSTSG